MMALGSGKWGAVAGLLLTLALIAGSALAVLLVPAAGARAASGWSLPLDLSERDASDVYNTRMALGPDGFPHVVWREWDGADNQVYYARKTGNGWTAPVNLSTGFGGNFEPRIAVDGSGNPHVTWFGNDVTDIILYITSLDGGWTWETVTCLNTTTTGNQNPDIALDPGGHPYVVWSAEYAATDRVFFTRFDGSAWTAPVNVSPGVNEAYGPHLAVDGDGRPHVAWRGHNGVTSHIYYTSYNGSAWSVPLKISDGAGLTLNRFPDLALDGDGNPHVVWQTYSASENHICSSASTGSGWSAPFILSSATQDNWYPRLEVDGAGTSQVAWQGSGGTGKQIYYAYGTGGSWSEPVAISSGSTENSDVQIALDGSGFPGAVWHGVDDSTERIFFSRSTASGWTNPVSISSGVAESHAPQLALDSDGFPHVAWYGSDGAHNQAWYARDNTEMYRFYFAEGCTGPGFQEYLCLGNPGDTEVAVEVTYLFTDGTSQAGTYAVPARSRFTADVNAAVGADKNVSIKCAAGAPFVAERPMYFDYTGAGESWTGGSDVVGAPSLSREWYFAEGYTGPGFDEYICVLNPGTAAARLTFEFQTQEEGLVVPDGLYYVPAHSRATFKANDLLNGGSYQASLTLTSDLPVVAERPMYFSYQGMAYWGWTGGHCVMGVPSLARDYYFAEGYTGTGFEEWLTLQNPNAEAIRVDASYQLGSGAPVTDYYDIPANTRTTVYVPGVVGEGQDVSVHLTSASYFLAERPMYFYYTGTASHDWTGGHCVIGATAAATDWFFAEGYTGDNFEEWLCIQNPGATDAVVQITYYPEGGTPIEKAAFTVAAGSRFTVNVNADAGPGLSLSAGLASDQPVIVERPMYFNYNGAWSGGHDVVGY